MKKTKKKKHVVKAWEILLEGEPAHYDNGKEVVFAKTKKEAKACLDNNAYKVVPITITYE